MRERGKEHNFKILFERKVQIIRNRELRCLRKGSKGSLFILKEGNEKIVKIQQYQTGKRGKESSCRTRSEKEVDYKNKDEKKTDKIAKTKRDTENKKR